MRIRSRRYLGGDPDDVREAREELAMDNDAEEALHRGGNRRQYSVAELYAEWEKLGKPGTFTLWRKGVELERGK